MYFNLVKAGTRTKKEPRRNVFNGTLLKARSTCRAVGVNRYDGLFSLLRPTLGVCN